MDGKTFDSLTKLTATSTGRRRLLQAAGTAGIGSLLTRGVVGAQDVVAAACQNRQSTCNRNRNCECHTGEKFKNVACDPLPGKCKKNGDRCCGKADATCDQDCDCCKNFKCNNKKCVNDNNNNCKKKGDHCNSSNDCCNDLKCNNHNKCQDKNNNNCKHKGDHCNRSRDCCNDLKCNNHNKCS